MYRCARGGEWDRVQLECKLRPKHAKHVSSSEGTTSLHLAVMSRMGYKLKSGNNKEHKPAPLDLIEDLLKAYPEAACVADKENTYTPITYACLVNDESYDVDDALQVVQLLLEYSPNCVEIFTSGGLSPLDVHIVSYSHHYGKQQIEPIGRSSTGVLRCLLETCPTLAQARLEKDKINGPLELLFRCNTDVFMEAVNTEPEDSDDEMTVPEKRGSVVKSVSRTWAWKWSILVLKYHYLAKRPKGAQFLAVHAAADMPACPLPVLSLTMYAFPKQIRVPDEVHGYLPLHSICSWPCHQEALSEEAVTSARKAAAISAVLQEFAHGAKTYTKDKESALELAIASGTSWEGGLRKIIRANPKAISSQSQRTGLYPFMAAAVKERVDTSMFAPKTNSKRSMIEFQKAVAKNDLQVVKAIYGMLRVNPNVLVRCVEKKS